MSDEPTVGHNSDVNARLRSIVERVERLEEERKALGSDVRDVFKEAKSAGFDVRVLRQLIRIRKQEPAEVEEQEMLLDLYRRAIGDASSSPIAAARKFVASVTRDGGGCTLEVPGMEPIHIGAKR